MCFLFLKNRLYYKKHKNDSQQEEIFSLKEFYIKPNDSGQRLNKFLEKAVPALPGGLAHKYMRLKRIKVNGKRAEPSYKLRAGDLLQLYIND